MLFPKINISGFTLFSFRNIDEAARCIIQEKKIAVSVNAEVLVNDHAAMKEIINAGIGYADGVGAVLSAQACGYADLKKIAGVELWLEVLRTYGAGSIYLIGAKPEVVGRVAQRIEQEYPRLRVAGFSDGYFNTEQQEALCRDIVQQRPDIVVIATGQPRQELLAKQISQQHQAIFLCVGGAFDVYAGLCKRAPEWLIKLKLEWLYRLVQNPSRYKRYMKLFQLFPLLLQLRLHRSVFPTLPKNPSDINVH